MRKAKNNPKWKLHNADILDFSAGHIGLPFHAVLCDSPYHLQSVLDRFGKKGSAPAKHGDDGAFGRSSVGFLGEEWDGGQVAWKPETWRAIYNLLYPGALVISYTGSRGWHRQAVAMEDAGFIMHPSIFAWAESQSFPKPTNLMKILDRRAKTQEDGDLAELAKLWAGHHYGTATLKPLLEPILIMQKPHDVKAQVDGIIKYGTGTYNIGGSTIDGVRTAPNGVLLHHPMCYKKGFEEEEITTNRFTDGAKPWGDAVGEDYHSFVSTAKVEVWDCVPECPAYKLEQQEPGAARYYFQASWMYESWELLQDIDPWMYMRKPGKEEKTVGMGGDKNHPTLKPIHLNMFLASILLPSEHVENRRILVPFAGVGSEMIGAMKADWDEVVGVELMPNYVELGRQRLKWWAKESYG